MSPRQKTTRSPAILKKKTLCVVGGTGRIGQVFVSTLKREFRSVDIGSRDPERAKATAHRLRVKAVPIPDASKYDVAIVSVPIDLTKETVVQIARDLKPKSLIVDLSSVKQPIVEGISSGLPEGIEYLSLHPLFGPDTKSLQGKTVVSVSVRAGVLSQALLEVLRKRGARIIESSPQQHDRLMGMIQGAHHFAMLCLGSALNKSGFGPQLREFATDSFKNTLSILDKTWSNLGTILQIQKYNPYCEAARASMVEVANRLRNIDSFREEQLTF